MLDLKNNLLSFSIYSKFEKLIQPVVVDEKDSILWIPNLMHGKINCNKNEKLKVINWVQI